MRILSFIQVSELKQEAEARQKPGPAMRLTMRFLPGAGKVAGPFLRPPGLDAHGDSVGSGLRIPT